MTIDVIEVMMVVGTGSVGAGAYEVDGSAVTIEVEGGRVVYTVDGVSAPAAVVVAIAEVMAEVCSVATDQG